jgi:hypothetical protein
MDIGKLKVALVQIVTVSVLLLFALIAYVSFLENEAEKRANEFCNALRVGEDVHGLRERTIDAGADERKTKWVTIPYEGEWLPVMFAGGTPLSRHICSIHAANGKITKKEYAYVD